jgi:transcriptional regulator with XRE-family HTH domain
MADNDSRSAIFARHVRRLREERRWSQAELGRRLGVAGHTLGQSRIAAIEAHGQVTLDQVDAFAATFGVPIEELLYDPRLPPARGVTRQRLIALVERAGMLRDDLYQLVEPLTASDLREQPGITFTRPSSGPVPTESE